MANLVIRHSGRTFSIKTTGAGTDADPYILGTGTAGASTATVASVASSATNVTLLAANANRKGAAVYNESTAVLKLKLGATASATSYTIQVAAGGYYEVPFGFTGRIDGLWASADGSARITELS
jgi:hypothetical protein